ncbi:unnamed protein product [Schistocephalus solidus]|uniref:RING-type domain-containing protein n=1 Tax=Schistocephalus solidus TaxID=70667 RepID=A0A183SV90_SCHSO|nr:unnamed protein product [Schistocephalus solidus]
MKFVTLIFLLSAAVVLSFAAKHIVVISGSKSFLEGIPKTCFEYIKDLIKWEIIVTSKKDIDWIISWTNSTTCSKCISSNVTKEDIYDCMTCLLPHKDHIIKLPGCHVCLNDIKNAKKVCKRCLAEVIYVTESILCMVEVKVRKTMLLLELGV